MFVPRVCLVRHSTLMPITRYHVVLKNLSFHLSGNFKDKVFRNIDNRLYDPALWLMDAGIFYTIKNHVTLALNVNNLFDKEYFERTTIMAKPRNYQASVSYTF